MKLKKYQWYVLVIVFILVLFGSLQAHVFPCIHSFGKRQESNCNAVTIPDDKKNVLEKEMLLPESNDTKIVGLDDIRNSDKLIQDGMVLSVKIPEANNKGYYNSDIVIELEAFFANNKLMIQKEEQGIKKVYYTITNSGVITKEATLFEVSPQENNQYVHSLKKKIRISAKENEGDNVVLKIFVESKNGSVETKTCKFKIDTTTPKISISFDQKSCHDNYYNKKIKATIKVKDLHIKPSMIRVSVYENGELEESKKIEWDAKADGYSTVFSFQEDGEYGLIVRAQDSAGNKESVLESGIFIIDTKKPILEIASNDLKKVNGVYYKNNREIKVHIKDKNITPNIQLEIENENNPQETYKISHWDAVEDGYIATIECSNDGSYNLNVVCYDLAGNESNIISNVRFVIDTKPPEVRFSKVKRYAAYNSVKHPVIEVEDENYSDDGVKIIFEGCRSGVLEEDNQSIYTTNGIQVKLNSLELVETLNDIYTISVKAMDLAGNETEASICFSINQYGSIYTLGEESENVLKQKYVSGVSNLIVKEINTNEVVQYSIKCIQNDSIVLLSEGRDYNVVCSEKGEAWKEYTYTIYSSAFTEEGNYSLLLSSVDSVGNISSNKLDKKDIQFIVDYSKPTCVVSGIDYGKTYNNNLKQVRLSVLDNIQLNKIRVLVNGKEFVKWEDIKELNNDGNFRFYLQSSNQKQNVMIECVDSAGNVLNYRIDNILITTNLWVRLFENKGSLCISFCIIIVTGCYFRYYTKKFMRKSSFIKKIDIAASKIKK